MKASTKRLDQHIFIPFELKLTFYSKDDAESFKEILSDAEYELRRESGILKIQKLEMINYIKDTLKLMITE